MAGGGHTDRSVFMIGYNRVGAVYPLTKREAEVVAEWLTAHGISAEAYRRGR